MTTPDIINGIFEAGLSFFLWKGVLKLRADKAVLGFYWPTVVWTTMWGLWNLFYYPHLDQWASFAGGAFVVTVNIIWLAHVAYYARAKISAMCRRGRQNRMIAPLLTMLRSLSGAARRACLSKNL